MSDAPVMQSWISESGNALNSLWKQEIGLGLKILGRVILSCQFKSGPGHQSNSIKSFINSGFHSGRRASVCRRLLLHIRPVRKKLYDKQRHQKTQADAPVMHGWDFVWPVFGGVCLHFQH